MAPNSATQKGLAIQISLTLCILLPFHGLAMGSIDEESEIDKEAVYIGHGSANLGLEEMLAPPCESIFGTGNCPIPIVPGLLSSTCDDNTWAGLGMHQGFGGVWFCNVPKPGEVVIKIEDDYLYNVVGHVYCFSHDFGEFLFVVAGSGSGSIPSTCLGHAHDDPGTTRLLVYLQGPPEGVGATTGSVRATFSWPAQ